MFEDLIARAKNDTVDRRCHIKGTEGLTITGTKRAKLNAYQGLPSEFEDEHAIELEEALEAEVREANIIARSTEADETPEHEDVCTDCTVPGGCDDLHPACRLRNEYGLSAEGAPVTRWADTPAEKARKATFAAINDPDDRQVLVQDVLF